MRIHTIDLGFLGLDEAIAAFVIESDSGPVLVETGPATTLPRLEQRLEQLGLALGDFKHVLLTHIHFDHAGAAWALARAGATIYVHPVGKPHLEQPGKLYQSARMIYGEQMDALWGPMEPIPPEQVYAPAHGEVIRVGELSLTAWYTPGHATHHIAWEVNCPDAESVVFTGDVAGVMPIPGGFVAPPCPPPDIHVEDWLSSIQLLRDLPSQVLYLTHFGPVYDKVGHLRQLEQNLLAWAEWMKPYAMQQTPTEQIVPVFQAYVQAQLAAGGIPADGLPRYEAANPSFMSVAGLMRYWKKRLASTT
jgi:glyoxylase-like metal-dependent hydrolase (beta-lactamase superfamily II)